MNMVERLAAIEPEVSLRSWWRLELKEEGALELDLSGGLRDQIASV